MTKTYFTKNTGQIDEQETVLELSLSYRLGTASSWYDGTPRPRGMVLQVTPVRYRKGDGYVSKEFRIGDDRGRSFFIKSMKRRVDSVGQRMAGEVEAVFEALADAATEQNWPKISRLIQEHINA